MTKIENEKQYNWALGRVEELLPLVTDETSIDDPNSIELELLSNLVADYSEVHFALAEPKFIDILKLRMYEMGFNKKTLSAFLNISTAKLNNIISGKSEPSLGLAREMSQKLNIDPRIVLGA